MPETVVPREEQREHDCSLKNRSIIQPRSERRGRGHGVRGLNPVFRDPQPGGRPITQVVELRERTRRHRISAEIAERQIGRTIYSHSFREDSERQW